MHGGYLAGGQSRERVAGPILRLTPPNCVIHTIVLTIQQIACHRCNAALAVEINVCPHCDSTTMAEVSQPSAADAPASDNKGGQWDWIHRRRTVLFVLLCATGVLGLPALWLSRAFSARAKVVWSIVVTVETALLVWLCYRSVQTAIEAFEPLLG